MFHSLKNVPIIIDSEGNTVSFPPIINAALTTVTTKTKNILVEVTSIEKDAAEDMLSVVSSILQMAGFQIFELKISGGKNSTPKLIRYSWALIIKLVQEISRESVKPNRSKQINRRLLPIKLNGSKV